MTWWNRMHRPPEYPNLIMGTHWTGDEGPEDSEFSVGPAYVVDRVRSDSDPLPLIYHVNGGRDGW